MGRAILILVLYLALGLVTSVAVAWVCAVAYEATDKNTRELLLYGVFDHATIEYRGNFDRGSWHWKRYDHTGTRSGSPLLPWSAMHHLEAKSGRNVIELATGWPMFCLRSERVSAAYEEHPFEARSQGHIGVRFSLPWPSWKWVRVQSVPSKPMWSGLAVNTVVWAIVWVLVGMAPIRWRYNKSRRRVPKGLCGWCSYDLCKTPRDANCPECGRAANRPPRLFAWPSRIVGVIALLVIIAIEAGFILACKSGDGIEPIHWAAYRGDIDTVRRQLVNGVDPDLLTDPSLTTSTVPLVLAIEQGHAEVAEVLLDAGAEPGAGFRAAICQNDLRIIRRIMSTFDQAELKDEILNEGLGNAASCSAFEAAALLIELGADPSGHPGMLAPIRSSRDPVMIEYLLDQGAVATEQFARGTDPVSVAFWNDRVDLASRLIEAGFLLTPNDLQHAIMQDSLPRIRWLVETGDVASNPAVHVEYLFVHVMPDSTNRELWEYLVSIGADVNADHPAGGTPLHRALTWEDPSPEYVQFLLEHGADPNEDIGDGRTCIDAARTDHIRQLLIEAAEKLDREEAAEN